MNTTREKGSVVKVLFKRKDTSVFLATALLFVIFSFFPNFLNTQNMFFLARTASINFFIALGQVFVIMIGGMNLSLGNIGGLAVVTVGICLQEWKLPGFVAVMIALVVGILAGWFNGLLVNKLRLSSFMATLATSFIYMGLVNGVSKGISYSDIPESYTAFGKGDFFGIPYLMLFMILLAVLMYLFFQYTVYGREMLSTGGSLVAARLSGIKVNNYVMLANVLSGFFAAMAGCIWVSRSGSAAPATGSDWMITSFAVAIIGGTSQMGGDCYPFGMIAGAFLMALIKNGLTIAKANVYYEQAYLGIIILLAVALDSFRMIRLERLSHRHNVANKGG